MTATTYSTSPATRSWPAYAVGSFGIAAVLTALAFYVDVFGPTETGESDPIWVWLATLGVAGVIAGLVFSFVVRTAPSNTAERRGLIVAVVSVPTVVVFWSGLPIMLAAAAGCLALSNGRPSAKGSIALALALALFGFSGWLCLAG